MTPPPKPSRPVAGGGQARTRLARRAVVQAARSLFLERGYQTTTIESVSSRSEVPAPTIYRLFGSKIGILKALLDVSIAGDDDATPVADRAAVADLLAAEDPAEVVGRFVDIAVAINTNSTDLYAILSSAATADPAAAALFEEYQRQRAEGQGVLARRLARSGALRPGLRERDAADVVHALGSPELFRLLVVDRGWDTERYERWLAATLAEQLLGRVAPAGATDRAAPAGTARRVRR